MHTRPVMQAATTRDPRGSMTQREMPAMPSLTGLKTWRERKLTGRWSATASLSGSMLFIPHCSFSSHTVSVLSRLELRRRLPLPEKARHVIGSVWAFTSARICPLVRPETMMRPSRHPDATMPLPAWIVRHSMGAACWL